MSITQRAYFDLLAAVAIIGSSVVVGKIVVTDFPIFTVLMIHFAVALRLLLLISHRQVGLRLPSTRVLVQFFCRR